MGNTTKATPGKDACGLRDHPFKRVCATPQPKVFSCPREEDTTLLILSQHLKHADGTLAPHQTSMITPEERLWSFGHHC